MNQSLPKISYVTSHTQPGKAKVATCPSCGHHGLFTFVGNQHLPLELARSKGMKTVIPLWTCDHCDSTISEMRLIE